MEQDHWDRDPAVQRTRRVFAEMEKIQETMLNQVEIKPFDSRLRPIREAVRNLFDKAAGNAGGRGIRLSDAVMIGIYTMCLHQALTAAGIVIATDLLPDDRTLRDLVCEVSQ